MAINLSEGSIAAIMTGEITEKPILQVLGIRKLMHPGSTDRYRVMLSDSVHSINFAMLATQHNHKIESGEITENTIIRLNHHITSKLSKEKSGERRVLIILDIEVLVPGSEVTKIGTPSNLTDDANVPPPVVQRQTNNGYAQAGMSNGAQNPYSGARGAPSMSAERPTKVPRLELPPGDIMTRPISSINPYQNKWIIRARVISKTPIRTWSNARGEGRLFSMDLKDESGEIRATAFTDECDKFYNTIEVNSVYYISNCVVKAANKKYSQIRNDFELSFTKETQVIPVTDDISSVPGVEYDFKTVASLAEMAIDSLVDVIGVCKSAGEVQTLIARASGKELKKRDVTIVDTSLASITLTLWGEKAEQFDPSSNPIVAIRQGKITEFQQSRSIGTPMSTTVLVNPDLPEAHRLRGWFDNGGANEVMTSISASSGQGSSMNSFTGPWKSLLEVKEEKLGFNEKEPDYYNAVVNIITIRRENCWYLACTTAECKKKVVDNNNGTYHCAKCNVDHDTFHPRLILSMCVADWSDQVWITMFDSEATLLLGMDGRKLMGLKEVGEEAYNAAFDKVKFVPIQVRLRVKAETYNDEQRLKTTVMKMEYLDTKEYNKRMLQEIKNLQGQGIKVEPR